MHVLHSYHWNAAIAVVSPLHETVTRVQKGCTGLQRWSQLWNSGLYHSWRSMSSGEWKKKSHSYLYFIYMYYKWLILIQIIMSIVAFTILHFYKFFSIIFGHTPPPFSTTSLFLINTMATMTPTIFWNSYR